MPGHAVIDEFWRTFVLQQKKHSRVSALINGLARHHVAIRPISKSLSSHFVAPTKKEKHLLREFASIQKEYVAPRITYTSDHRFHKLNTWVIGASQLDWQLQVPKA